MSETIYTPTQWKDHVVEKPRTYRMESNGDGTVTLYPAFGRVEQQGTPINANNLNNMERGIQLAFEASKNIEQQLETVVDEMLGGAW